MGDNVGIMRDGVIEQQGSPEDLILHPVNDYVVNFLDNIDRTKLK
jgi:glycine betaine/proline transport system ATP-binding protein